METPDLLVFQYDGRRLAVTFDSTSIENYDPGFRTIDGSKAFFPHTVKHISYSYQRNREGIICILRNAYTGTPYSGIAILHPDEADKSDPRKAATLALKRAIAAYVVGEGIFSCTGDPRQDIMDAFNTEMLKGLDPESIERVVVERMKKEAIAKRNESIAAIKKHVKDAVRRAKRHMKKVDSASSDSESEPEKSDDQQ